MSIEQTIAAAVSDAIQPDKIKAIIEPQIEQMLTRALGELFSYRGPVTSAVETAIKDQMKIDPDQLNFTSYNAMMLAVMQKHMETKADAALAKMADEELSKIFRDPPEETTISELIRMWMRENELDPDMDDRDDYYEIRRHDSDLTGKGVALTLTLKSPDAIASRIEVDIWRDKISCVTVKDWRGKRGSTSNPSFEFSLGRHGIERDICKMYAAGTRVIDDE